MFMPDVIQWVDVVKFDVDKKIRTEIGRNITKAGDGVKLNEDTTWTYNEEKKSTIFHRKLELEVPGIPSYFINKCVGFYDDNVMRVRNEEAESIRKLVGGSTPLTNNTTEQFKQPTSKATLDTSVVVNFFIKCVLVLLCSLVTVGLFDFVSSSHFHFDNFEVAASTSTSHL